MERDVGVLNRVGADNYTPLLALRLQRFVSPGRLEVKATSVQVWERWAHRYHTTISSLFSHPYLLQSLCGWIQVELW